MRIAALYDIHGNLPALEAVLAEIRQIGVDEILIGGDVIPGPMPYETIETLMNLDIPARFIMGNGDDAVLAERKGEKSNKVPESVRGLVSWVAEQLSPEQEAFIASWPLSIRMATAMGEVLFCHASPRNNTEVFTKLTVEEKLLPVFEGLDVPLVVCGHTHMQFDRMIGNLRLVNAGSVGMPYGVSMANWLLLEDIVAFRQTSYALDRAAERIRATKYPKAEDFAENNVLQVPSLEIALETLGKMELNYG